MADTTTTTTTNSNNKNVNDSTTNTNTTSSNNRINNHPIRHMKSSSMRLSSGGRKKIITDKEYYNSIKEYLMTLPIIEPHCIPITNNNPKNDSKRKIITKKCTCLQIFNNVNVASAVAAYLVIDFGYKKIKEQQIIVSNWIRYAKALSNHKSSLKYLLPARHPSDIFGNNNIEEEEEGDNDNDNNNNNDDINNIVVITNNNDNNKKNDHVNDNDSDDDTDSDNENDNDNDKNNDTNRDNDNNKDNNANDEQNKDTKNNDYYKKDNTNNDENNMDKSNNDNNKNNSKDENKDNNNDNNNNNNNNIDNNKKDENKDNNKDNNNNNNNENNNNNKKDNNNNNNNDNNDDSFLLCNEENDDVIKNFKFPGDILNSTLICQSALITILGVGRTWWSSCKVIAETGIVKQHGAKGKKSNRSKTFDVEVVPALNEFFNNIKNIDNNNYTRKYIKKHRKRKENVPPKIEIIYEISVSKRNLYQQFCELRGYKVTYTVTGSCATKPLDEWINNNKQPLRICSWGTFHRFMDEHYPEIRVTTKFPPEWN